MDAESVDSGLVHRIETQLRQMIVRGELADAAKLRQDHIAAEFGATAAPVREALRRLENARLVISRPRRGVVVAPILPGDALEVAEMRAALESLALRLALPRSAAADATAAADAIEKVNRSADIGEWLAANRDFHLALYRPCCRPRLLDAIQDLWLTGDRHLYRVWATLDYKSQSQDEHRAILAACAAQDADAAAALLTRHILEAGAALEATLRRQGAAA